MDEKQAYYKAIVNAARTSSSISAPLKSFFSFLYFFTVPCKIFLAFSTLYHGVVHKRGDLILQDTVKYKFKMYIKRLEITKILYSTNDPHLHQPYYFP